MNTNAKTHHTRMGMASFAIGLLVWVFLIIATLIIFFTDAYKTFEKFWFERPKGQITGFGFEGFFELIVLLLFVYLVIPVAGHLVGLGLAAAGLIQQKKKRLFALLGLPINALYFIFVAIFLLGLMLPG